jgi:hypothetical protein
MEYTLDEQSGEISFSFPYYAQIYLDGEQITSSWYEWTFDYKEFPKGYYVLDFIETNESSAVPGSGESVYSFTMQLEVK